MTYDPNTTSADIVDGAIVNADVNASAAIADSKLSLTTTVSGTAISSTNKIVDQSSLPVLPFPKPQSTDWLSNAMGSTAMGSAIGEATEIAVPIRFAYTITLDRLSVYVATAGSAGAVVRLGIRNDNNSRPGTVLLDAGTAVTTSTDFKNVTINQQLAAGVLYWLTVTPQGTPTSKAIVRSSGVAQPFIVPSALVQQTQMAAGYRTATNVGDTGSTTGALPSSIGTLTSAQATEVPVFWFRSA